MFRIAFGDMQQAYKEIENQMNKQNMLIVEVKEVLKNISAFEGMEDIQVSLNKQIECLEIEQIQYIQILQALNLILTYYAECEKRIISRYELGEYRPLDISLKRNDFTSIAKELESIKVE